MNYYDQIFETYIRMFNDAFYRPGAESDGMGNIIGELDLGQEVYEYARSWRNEEDSMSFHIGVPSFENRPALVFTIEAARAMAANDKALAMRLLELAAEAIS